MFDKLASMLSENPLFSQLSQRVPAALTEVLTEMQVFITARKEDLNRRVVDQPVAEGQHHRGFLACVADVGGGDIRGVMALRGAVLGGTVRGVNLLAGDVHGGDVRAVNALVGAVRGGRLRAVNLIVGSIHGGEVHGAAVVMGDIHGGKVSCQLLLGDIHGGEVKFNKHLGQDLRPEAEQGPSSDPTPEQPVKDEPPADD